MATFLNLQDDTLERLNFDNTATSSTPRTRIQRFLNEWHHRILSMPGFNRLRDDTLTFASVASTAQYAMPQAVSRIKGLSERTNYNSLRQLTLSQLRDLDPGLTASGTADAYIEIGRREVATQPAAATGLWVVSTSASDTNTAYVETVRTGGYLRQESVAMTGVTRAQLGTLTDHIEVDRFYVSAAALGAISLYDASTAGNELARIPIGQSFTRYLTIQLWPTPNAAVTYYLDYTREIFEMANSTDQPLLPPDFHWLLALGARLNEYEQQDDSRMAAARQEMELGLRRLHFFLINNPDFLVVPGMRQRERSRLGGWFPAGS